MRLAASGRARRPLTAFVLLGVVVVIAGAIPAAAMPASGALILDVPRWADGETSTAIELSLPGHVPALEGRVLFDTAAMDLVGVAPVGAGDAFAPAPIDGGAAFAAYGLSETRGRTRLQLVVFPHGAGVVDVDVVVDAGADGAGRRLGLDGVSASGRLVMGRGGAHHAAPPVAGSPDPHRSERSLRDLMPDGRLDRSDLDLARAGWDHAHANGAVCGHIDMTADANGDGCMDIVDVQLVASAVKGRPREPTLPTAAAADAGATFVVTSPLDTPDATNGDDVCADSEGRCTLRAAITESNWQSGDNRIEFNLAGQAPVLIQLGSSPMSLIQDRSGRLVIDGYSQPGARVNTASAGSNAVPGVVIRGTGGSPRGVGLRITSGGNTVRGILFNNVWRAIVIEGEDAANNRIVGNLFGYKTSGANTTWTGGYSAVLLNNGAHGNTIGTPAPADRNVAGNGTKAFYLYGPGTDDNVIQNNVMCLTPSGVAGSICQTALDMNFGPKDNVVGGTAENERNVLGPTRLNGVEISHGWDPDGEDDPGRWELTGNRVVGNWIGFRADGAYVAKFRSGQRLNENDANGVNVIDGARRNVVEHNTIGAAWDGINIMNPNATENVVRTNTIGVSPRGEAAPLGRYGIHLRRGTTDNVVEANIIRNFAARGIFLADANVDRNRLSRNVMSNSDGPAIVLAPGANDDIAPPVISSATRVVVRGTARPGATVEVYRASRAAGAMGLPTAYLGSTTAAGDGSWSLSISVARGDTLTALQIDAADNTSAVATNVAATRA
jgi:CSLREA domain-containing protein